MRPNISLGLPLNPMGLFIRNVASIFQIIRIDSTFFFVCLFVYLFV